MSKRVKTALSAVGILLGCIVLALLISVIGASEEDLRLDLEVSYSSELSAGRYLVRPLPEPEAGKTLPIAKITRYPFGFAVVQTRSGESVRRGRPVAVRTRELASGIVKRSVLAFGTVKPAFDARVAAEVNGTAVHVHFKLGTEIAKGAPLVTLDSRERTIAHRRAEAELERAKAALKRGEAEVATLKEQLAIATDTRDRRDQERKRWATLAESNVASQDRADQAYALWRAAVAGQAQIAGSYAVAQAALEEGQAGITLAAAARDAAALSLERCTIKAPIAGRVAEIWIEEGNWVAPGQAVVRLVNNEGVRIRVHVSEEEALSLEANSVARVTIPGVSFSALPAANGDGGHDASNGDGGAKEAGVFPARLMGVAASADPQSRKVAVDVWADNPHDLLRAGMFARVHMDGGEVHDATLVPDAGIVMTEDGAIVYVIQDDTARVQRVSLGPRQGEGRIVRDLTGAVEIAVEGTGLLFDGAEISRLAWD